MKIKLLTIGKTDSRPLKQLIDEYCKRLGFYIPFSMDIIPDIKNTKNLTTKQQKIAEGKELLKKIEKSDAVILLDENGKLYNSIQFSAFLHRNWSRCSGRFFMKKSIAKLDFMLPFFDTGF